jgi:BirA family biotin operon repressor/biotin-[acetyl-CoA-carboxylase] ligase
VNDGPARVLDLLRRGGGGPTSGEALSGALGVSRAQIWKHVEALRALGYGIDGEAGGGYRLVALPDRLYPEELSARLETRWLGRTLHWFESTDSTNRVALELAQRGAPHGAAVIAEGQTAGRGRLGRAFFSPPFTNLYTSLVLRPEIALPEAPTWILGAAVAVADAVAVTVGDESAVAIKWPNDVLLGGRKTSGILMELGAEGARVSHLVLGIGVNLNVERELFPEDFRAHATSLRSHSGRTVDRVAFTVRLYHALEGVLDAQARGGFAAVRPRFEARFRMPGREIRVSDGARVVGGTCLGIDDDGALRIAGAGSGGEVTRVLAGDVTVLK